MAKVRNEEEENGHGDENVSMSTKVSYEDRLKFVNAIAKPMAGRKLTKKIYKLIKKAHKDKDNCWTGLKATQQKLRKGGDGIVIIAGDVMPIDVASHLPGVCEDKDLPYIYVPSKEDIGTAMGVNRAVVSVFIAKSPSYEKEYDEVLAEIKKIPLPV